MTLQKPKTINRKVAHFFWFNSNHIGGIESHLKQLLTHSPYHYLFSGQAPTLPNEKYLATLDYKSKYNHVDNYSLKNLFVELGDNTIVNFHNPHVFKPEISLRILGLIKERNTNAKTVCTIHNFPADIQASKAVYRHFDEIHTVSHYMSDIVRNFMGLDCKIVPYLLDTNFPKSITRSLLLEKLKVFQPTRFCNWKGSHHSLKAVVELLEKGIPILFTHAGITSEDLPGAWDSRWEAQYPGLYTKVCHYMERGDINFTKYPSEKFFDVLKNYNVVLHPTIGVGFEGDPFPLSLQMAILNPISIIATNSGGIKEIVDNLSFGTLLEPNQYEPIYKALLEISNKKQTALTTKDIGIIQRKRISTKNALYTYNDILGAL